MFNELTLQRTQGECLIGSYDEVFSNLHVESDVRAGYFLTFGTEDLSAKEVSTASEKVIGLATVRQLVSDNDGTSNSIIYKAGQNVSYIQEGQKIVFFPVADVLKGQQAYIDVTTAGKIGRLTNVPTGNILIKGAFFEQDALADKMTTISFNINS